MTYMWRKNSPHGTRLSRHKRVLVRQMMEIIALGLVVYNAAKGVGNIRKGFVNSKEQTCEAHDKV